MKKTYRSGFDIDVALSTAAKRASPLGADALPPLAGPGVVGTEAAPAAPQAAANPHWRTRVKRLLRRPVAVVFRLARPFLRPIAFRTRSYLIEGLRQDVQHLNMTTQQELQRVSAQLIREVQSARELLRHDMLATPAHSNDEQQRILIGLVQELQASREALRRQFAEERQRSTLELQRVTSALHTVLEAQGATLRAALLEQGTVLRDALDAQGSALMPRLDRLEQYGYATARRVAVNCGGDVLVRTEAGYMLCSGEDASVLTCLVDSGDLERGTRLLIERLLGPGDIFIDVGANLGIHTLAAGRAMRAQGRIIAFEPFDATRRLLEKSIWINGLTPIAEVYGSAVSNKDGRQQLFLGASSGHHSLFELQEGDAAQAKNASIEVTTVRLDTVVAATTPFTLLKIDAEGAELDVLEGAAALVRDSQDIALIVEFGPAHLRRTGQDPAHWLAAFTAFGLEYLAIDVDNGMLQPATMESLEAVESTNLLFARPASAAWRKAREGA